MSDAESSGAEDFLGFDQETIQNAKNRYNRGLEQGSDIEFSDTSDVSDDSDADDDGEVTIGEAPPKQWTKQLTSIKVEAFANVSGPTTILPEASKEIDFFHLLFTPDLYQEIADETNRYAASKIVQSPDPLWRPTNAEEIRAYIAIQIIMAIVYCPDDSLYFTSDELYRATSISERITRDRYRKLNQYFHVCDNTNNPRSGQPGHDKLSHVRPLIDYLKDKFATEYLPHKEVTVDEAMISYTGRLGFKQYMPLKPTKRGVKVWVRADPHNGYVQKFDVYVGKQAGVVETGLGDKVVKDLTRDLFHKYHHVYCDNYFTSVALFDYLLDNDTYACGTVRTNRKGLPDDKAVKLKNQGDSNVSQLGESNMVYSSWQDKRTVNILSTNSDPTAATEVQRRKKDGTVLQPSSGATAKLFGELLRRAVNINASEFRKMGF